VRDAAGDLNGTIKNNVAFLKVASAAPAMARAEPVAAIIALLTKWASVGLTTVSELSLGALTQSPADAAVLTAVAKTGQLKARIRAYPFYTIGADAWDRAGVKPGNGDALARIAGYKLVADGSNQGFTGLQREPYLNSAAGRGTAYMTPDEMKSIAVDRASKGWPLALHGNGDAAIDMVLDACQAVRDAGIDMSRVRARIEHCSMLHDDQIARMKKFGVSASFLIGHVHLAGEPGRIVAKKAVVRETCRMEARQVRYPQCSEASSHGKASAGNGDHLLVTGRSTGGSAVCWRE
jgi:hypothetical protein